MPAESRDHDVVVLGATGFTGQLVADYLAATAPADLRWAVAGRNIRKLEMVRERLAASGGSSPEIGLIEADSTNAESMVRLARRTRVVATTVGPFMEYGAALVAACAEAGTDYADITGEAEFVDRMWLAHQKRALQTGAKLVHCCGFDSVPPDLGAWWSLRHLPADAPVSMRAYVRASGRISTGTYHSAVRAFGRARQIRETAAARKAREGLSSDRHVASLLVRPHREPGSGRWSVPLPTIDPLVVRRSARACAEYGPDFRYGHFAVVGSLSAVAATVTGTMGLRAAARVSPARAGLLRLRMPGEGPSAERRRNSWFSIRFVATAAGNTVVTEVAGGDPGYSETAKMLAESALSLACDDLPDRAGQLTPVQAMGPALLDRLRRADVRFELRDGGSR
jgi:saccharopine dehydrogenase (NAD+, L-glutamate forming)